MSHDQRDVMNIDTTGLVPPAQDPNNPPRPTPHMQPAPAAPQPTPVPAAHAAAMPEPTPTPVRADASTHAVASAQGEATEVARVDVNERSVYLSRPYPAFQLMVSEFTVRKPTALELRRCGHPLRNIIDPSSQAVTGVEVNYEAVARYIPLISKPEIPGTTVDQFEIEDLDACASAVVGFFLA